MKHRCQKCPVIIPIERPLCYFCTDPDELEGQRRFTLPINPDPITRRLKR